jgi:tetratricopeptide (TPR) repeat protein
MPGNFGLPFIDSLRTPHREEQTVARLAVLLAVAVGTSAGCFGGYQVNLTDRAAVKGTYEELDKETKAGRTALEARHTGTEEQRREAVKKAIDHLDKAAAIDPRDRTLWVDLSKACYYLGNYFTPPEKTDERMKIHEKGMEYAIRALLLNPEVKKAFDANESQIHKAVDAMTAGDVPAVFWLGGNWGRWAEPQSLAARASEAPKLKAVEERCFALGESYEYGGVHRFFGVYYFKAPGQKDPVENSKKHFDKALALGPKHLEAKVLMAEEYAVRTQDQPLYEKLLNEVLAFPEKDDPPDLRVVNWHARRRAKELLTEDAILERF